MSTFVDLRYSSCRGPSNRKGPPMAITSQDKALACEALSGTPGLSRLAALVGIQLINHADRNTGTAWPSEARLADALNCTTRAIRKAKAQLRALGFIAWQQRGRHRQRTPLYQIAWEMLRGIAAGIKQRLKGNKAAAQAHKPQRETGLGRNGRSTYPTQFKKIIGERVMGAFRNPSKPSHTNPAILEQRASARLYAALGGLPRHAFASILAGMSPDMEQQAITAERFRPGTGLETLLALLKGQAGATPQNQQPAAMGGQL